MQIAVGYSIVAVGMSTAIVQYGWYHWGAMAERVRIQLTSFRIVGKFVYPTLPKSLGMFVLVYPKRMAVGVKPKESKEAMDVAT